MVLDAVDRGLRRGEMLKEGRAVKAGTLRFGEEGVVLVMVVIQRCDGCEDEEGDEGVLR